MLRTAKPSLVYIINLAMPTSSPGTDPSVSVTSSQLVPHVCPQSRTSQHKYQGVKSCVQEEWNVTGDVEAVIVSF